MPIFTSKEIIDALYGPPPAEGQKKLEDFKKKDLPKPEKGRFSGYSELFEKLDIDAQYNKRYESLKQPDILEKLPSGEYGIIGIDNKEYPIPTLDQVKAKIAEHEAILGPKIEQGFTKILLVPFAMPLNTLIDKYKKTILKHHQQGTLKATNGEKLELDENLPFWTADEYANADINNNIVYYPDQFDQANHNGRTKQELLDTIIIDGWQIKLIEDLPDLPAENQGQTISGRKQSEANQTPIDYLSRLKTDPQYQNEQGLTPEDWLAYAIAQLEEKNQIIDDWQGNGKACYITGAYFPASGSVPCGGWSRDRRRARLGGSGARDAGSGGGSRSAVMV